MNNQAVTETTTRPFSPKIDRNYPKPKLKLPPGACDCHFHFIGPQKQFTLKPNHVFSHLEFEDTTFEDWEKMQAALGLSRGLHVLSMMYEHNYEIALHAQGRYGDRIKSVIVPWPHITDGELDILTKAGVVGYRITWRLTKEIDQRMVARTTERGWSMHYLHRADEAQMDALEADHPEDAGQVRAGAHGRRRSVARASTATASSSCCNASTPAAAG